MTAAASVPFPLGSFDGIHELISCANDVVDRGGRVEKAGKTYAEIHFPPTRLHSDAQKGLKFAHYFFRWGGVRFRQQDSELVSPETGYGVTGAKTGAQNLSHGEVISRSPGRIRMQFAVVFGDAVLLQLNRCLRRPFDDGFVIRGLIPRFGGNTLKSVSRAF